MKSNFLFSLSLLLSLSITSCQKPVPLQSVQVDVKMLGIAIDKGEACEPTIWGNLPPLLEISTLIGDENIGTLYTEDRIGIGVIIEQRDNYVIDCLFVYRGDFPLIIGEKYEITNGKDGKLLSLFHYD